MNQRAFRILVTSILIVLGMGVVVAFFITSDPKTQGGGAAAYQKQSQSETLGKAEQEAGDKSTDTGEAKSAPQEEPKTDQASGSPQGITAPDESGEPDPGQSGEASRESGQAVVPGDAPSGLHFRLHEEGPLTSIGSLDAENNPAQLKIDFSPYGAGVSQITLANFFNSRQREPGDQYTLIRGADERRPNLAIRRVVINGQAVNAYSEIDDLPGTAFVQVEPGVFEAQIVDANDVVVLKIRREFALGIVEGELAIHQGIENVSDQALNVQVEQWGPGDLPYIHAGYGDWRRIRFGYTDPRSPEVILASDSNFIKQRKDWISFASKQEGQRIWPNETSLEKNYMLAWVASTNRYFAFVEHPLITGPDSPTTLQTIQDVELWLQPRSPDEKSIADAIQRDKDNRLDPYTRYVNLRLVTEPRLVASQGTFDFSVGVYAGPLDRVTFAGTEPFSTLNLKELVIYQLGCAFCTFQPITHAMLWFLRFIDGQILSIGGIGIGVHDWGIAIIILVLVVRALLHPLTRRGQVSMQRMAKGVAKLQPELAKLKEKYKNNPKKLQQEQMALYREHNVNPVGGCIGMAPMLLQSPIWVALYAMLYFAVELRQVPAFYGIFQMAGDWAFLADLSQPDHFIWVGHSLLGLIPWIGRYLEMIPILGSVSSLNILPILMGAIFYFQQKYMQPPTTTLTPEQETQQKIMKMVMPLIFPLLLYNAPSGLTLYILTSSTIGIIESRYIRSHIDKLDMAEETKKKKKPGIWAQAMAEAQRRQQDKTGGQSGSSKRGKADRKKRSR